MIAPILYSFSIIFGSLFFGYFVQKKNVFSDPEKVSSSIVKNTFRFVSPVILCLSFWRLDLKNISIWTLPLVGLIISTVLLVVGRYVASLHKLSPKQSGSFITSSMFSNIGYTLGGFLCFVLYGELGLALAIMYTLYYTPYFYTIGFYVAGFYGKQRKAKTRKSFKEWIAQDIRFFPFLGFMLGVFLNFANIPRAGFFTNVNRVLVSVATFGYFSSIGLTFRFRAVKEFKAVCLSMSVIKFIISPLVGFGLAYLMGYHRVLDGLPMKIVLIESCMPVAFAALFLTVLFEIDKDLTNACWLVTTFMMVIVIPILVSLISVF